MTPRPFTLLFDSECPFCKLEVEWLQRRDRNGLLRAIDIAAPGFDAAAYGLTKERVRQIQNKALEKIRLALHTSSPDAASDMAVDIATREGRLPQKFTQSEN